MDDRLFQRAKENSSIVAVCGVKLTAGYPKRRGVCPLCKHGEKSKSYAFEVDLKRNSWRCYSCDSRGGSVIDLEHRLNSTGSETIVDAARRLAGDSPSREAVVAPAPVQILQPEAPKFSERFAAELWSEALPAVGTIAQRYLLSRGISGRVLIEGLKHLRFHPRAFHSGPRSRPLTYPGMVAQVVTHEGPTGGVHITYLARDGSGKANVPDHEPQKKMWGRQGIEGRPGGLLLGQANGSGPWLVAEGIESALSMAMLHDGPARPVAALSLDRLQGFYRLDRFERFDPDMPQPDPERPPFTWPVGPDDEVMIGVDHDMKPRKVRVRKMGGGTVDRILTATERARLCGTLASAAWRRAGAGKVSVKAPAVGEDFNDMLRRKQRESAA